MPVSKSRPGRPPAPRDAPVTDTAQADQETANTEVQADQAVVTTQHQTPTTVDITPTVASTTKSQSQSQNLIVSIAVNELLELIRSEVQRSIQQPDHTPTPSLLVPQGLSYYLGTVNYLTYLLVVIRTHLICTYIYDY